MNTWANAKPVKTNVNCTVVVGRIIEIFSVFFYQIYLVYTAHPYSAHTHIGMSSESPSHTHVIWIDYDFIASHFEGGWGGWVGWSRAENWMLQSTGIICLWPHQLLWSILPWFWDHGLLVFLQVELKWTTQLCIVEVILMSQYGHCNSLSCIIA